LPERSHQWKKYLEIDVLFFPFTTKCVIDSLMTIGFPYMFNRKEMKIAVLFILAAITLSGCFRNTPEKVSQRFVMGIQTLKWDAMAKMVDWNATSQYIRNTAPDARKDIIIAFATAFTKSDLKAMKESEIKHKMLYMSLISVKALEKTETTAKVKVSCRLEKTGETNKNDVTLQLKKVNREWKIVLTPDLLERQ